MPIDPRVLAEMEQLARQKAIIRQLESSNGQNMDHATLTSGPNKGQTAGGAYGMVPNSLKDFANQSMKRNMGVDPDILVEMDKPSNKVTQDLNDNQELDDKAAEMALKLINAKTGGDEAKTAYAWRTGQNQSDEALAKGAKTHPYAQAYMKLRDQMLKQTLGQQSNDSDDNQPAVAQNMQKPAQQDRVVASQSAPQTDNPDVNALASPEFANKIKALLGIQ